MKKILIPEASETMHRYRANLHCHSTISDGKKTPEQLKEDYAAHGYSVIAYTDHNALVGHNDLTDDTFLALNGVEYDVDGEYLPDSDVYRLCHICLIAMEPDNLKNVCYHREKYLWGNAGNYRSVQVFDEAESDYQRVYSAAGVSDMMKRGQDNGFFVTYNHPVWSEESYPQFTAYENMDAMEIVNYSSAIIGFDEDNGHCYEEMLRAGKRVFCVATDDNHNGVSDDHPKCDSYGGATVIFAPKLSYRTVTQALKQGNFYATTGTATRNGPEIESLVYEDGVVTIRTTPARMICFMPSNRDCQSAVARDGDYVTEASFRPNERAKWFRLTVIDREGFKAYTNAYFIDALKGAEQQ